MLQAVLIVGVLILFINYTYLILSFLSGWKHLSESSENKSSQTYISIIIPFRNEQNNLNMLLNRLKGQSYPTSHFEILLINDHSTDQSVDVINQNKNNTQQLRLLDLSENEAGKKQAIRKGVLNSNGELLITVDADCFPGLRWLESIENFYQHHRPDMIIGPVVMFPGKTYLSRIFSLEFMSLLASTAGAAGNKKPVMCNGANLAFKKSVINELPSVYQHPSASGDDIFLLEALKKAGKSIQFCKSIQASVFTEAPETFREFINQRIRWASKSKHYHDFRLKYVAISVFMINLGLLGLLIGSIINYRLFFYFLGITALKSIVDLALLKPVIKNFNILSVLKTKYFVAIQFLYPFYSLTIAVLSQFLSFKWKNRKYKETLIRNL
jgi:cellulose synthase/poly-beta-1,6-N-acetylglucosamine synthase-like glycosyltransferase